MPAAQTGTGDRPKPHQSADHILAPINPIARTYDLAIDVTRTDQFERVLRAYLLAGEDAGFRLHGPLAVRPRARLFMLEASIYPGPVAVKAFFEPTTGGPEPAEAEAYFTALSRGHEISRHEPGMRIVQPLALVEPLGVVIMEWVEGPTLTQAILAGSLPTATELMRKTGLWLATLHRARLAESRGLETDAMLAELQRCASQTPNRVSSYATRLTDRLAGWAAEIASQKVPSALLHGDFKPDNMIVERGQLVGIDLGLCYVNAAINDVAQFQNHIFLSLHDPRHFRHGRRTSILLEAFEAGYSRDGGMALPRQPLIWTRLCNAVRLLSGQVGGRNRVKALVAEWQIRALIRQLFRDGHR